MFKAPAHFKYASICQSQLELCLGSYIWDRIHTPSRTLILVMAPPQARMQSLEISFTPGADHVSALEGEWLQVKWLQKEGAISCRGGGFDDQFLCESASTVDEVRCDVRGTARSAGINMEDRSWLLST